METKELKVSEDTARFIQCIRALDEQYSLVLKALIEAHGERDATEIIEEKYIDQHSSLRDIIYEFITRSIDERITYKTFTEI